MKNEICGLGGVMSGAVNLVKSTRPDYLLKNRDKIFVQTFPGHYTPIYDTYPYSNYLTFDFDKPLELVEVAIRFIMGKYG